MKGIGVWKFPKKNFEWVPIGAPRSDLYRLVYAIGVPRGVIILTGFYHVCTIIELREGRGFPSP